MRGGLAGAGALALGLGGLPRMALAAPPFTPMADEFDVEVPTAWFDLSLLLVQQTAGFSPPVATRALAYAGVALYEALVPGMPDHRSLSGQLNGLSQLPQACTNPVYHWPTVANSSLAAILRSLFPTAPAEGRAAIDSMEARFAAQFGPGLPPGVYLRSVDRGQRVAAAVFEWSKSDGGHEGYLRNFPSDYVPPAGPGLWVPPPPGFLPALQPFWGSCRTFAIASGATCPPGDHTPYSEKPSSRFYAEAVEVYETVNDLTPRPRRRPPSRASTEASTSGPLSSSASIRAGA